MDIVPDFVISIWQKSANLNDFASNLKE